MGDTNSLPADAGIASLLAQMSNRQLTKLAPAYVAAWAEIGAGVAKNSTNPHYQNEYADLSAVLELVKPVAAKHGLAVLQMPGLMDGDKASVVTFLIHTSGEAISVTSQAPLGGKATAQSAGSCFTYLKRYALKALFGLADVDDDGEAASAPAPRKSNATPTPRTTYAETADQLIADIQAFRGTVDELEKKLRPRVEELGDEKVNEVYVKTKRALKAAKGGSK